MHFNAFHLFSVASWSGKGESAFTVVVSVT